MAMHLCQLVCLKSFLDVTALSFELTSETNYGVLRLCIDEKRNNLDKQKHVGLIMHYANMQHGTVQKSKHAGLDLTFGVSPQRPNPTAYCSIAIKTQTSKHSRTTCGFS
ncbi:hypothetical protein EDB81DRAFT_194358 [Dactylonectria macrodidyma]|uniref:Uncharacterized protein n=1 Tax=Dactylonectria macrodidyma TaxID=307937 RepID=A0A9P9JLS9_9HYPO|nr:hypothetical protein EDB81DRAFT_194358 [Dactylonectria macrodidyma]